MKNIKDASIEWCSNHIHSTANECFIAGAEWMKSQIYSTNNYTISSTFEDDSFECWGY